MFKAEPINLTEKYSTYKSWWKDWGWGGFPKAFLPEQGVRVTYNGEDVCAVFIYMTQTPIFWLENYISDKQFDRDIRDKALNFMIDEACKQAKELGGSVAMSAVNSTSLKKRLEEKEFNKTDENLCGFARGL